MLQGLRLAEDGFDVWKKHTRRRFTSSNLECISCGERVDGLGGCSLALLCIINAMEMLSLNRRRTRIWCQNGVMALKC